MRRASHRIARMVCLTLAALVLLTGCSVPLGYGARLNSDGTVDAIECSVSPEIERVETVPNWEVVQVYSGQLARDDLVVDTWVWQTAVLPFAPNRPCEGLEELATSVAPTPLSLTGLALAAILALAPLVVVLALARANWRQRSSNRAEKSFWWPTGIYGLALGTVVVLTILAVALRGDDSSVIVAGFLSLPTSLVPTVLYSTTMSLFFSRAEWSAFAYSQVIVFYLLSIILWAFAVILGIRRLAQRSRQPLQTDAV